jgi:23S rRNA (cytosine1962-C5)-methyltransferase
MGYQLLDSGHGYKWELFEEFIIQRPAPQAVWRPSKQIVPHASFTREGGNRWVLHTKLPSSWVMEIGGVKMKIALTEFGHLGVFPEHASLWGWIRAKLHPGAKVLNLFAYSGGASLVAAQAGASVCHLDASKGMVDWGKENSALNGLSAAPIRWIVDDAMKFIKREIKREVFYDAIILDPPTFGRGAKGELFKIEEEIIPLLELCKELLSKKPLFLLFSCHTPGFTPIVLSHLLKQVFKKDAETSELLLESQGALSIPSGSIGKVIYGNQ